MTYRARARTVSGNRGIDVVLIRNPMNPRAQLR